MSDAWSDMDWQSRADTGRDLGGRHTDRGSMGAEGNPARPSDPEPSPTHAWAIAHQVTRQPCPECGMPVEQHERHRGLVTYVDAECPFCEWALIDTEGGI
jgi:hypothetical protein